MDSIAHPRLGKVVVDDVRRGGRNVDAAGGDDRTGGHEEAQLALPRRFHHFLTVGLSKVRVEPFRVEALLLKRESDAFRRLLGVAEDDGALGVLDFEHLKEIARLVAAKIERLVADFEGANVVAARRDELWVLRPRLRQALNLWGERRAEEQGLSRRWKERQDVVDLRQETHRQHLVTLIEDDRADTLRVERAASQMIEHAAGRTGDNLRAVVDSLNLRGHRRTAVNCGDLRPAVLGERFELPTNLKSELSRRAEDQDLYGRGAPTDDRVDDGEAVGRGFAGAGASLNHEIRAAAHRIEDRALNRSRMNIAELVYCSAHLRREFEDVEDVGGGGGERGLRLRRAAFSGARA